MEKEVLKLIDFLLYLNEKKIINNYDFDYLKEAELYLKQLKKTIKINKGCDFNAQFFKTLKQ
jgi:hypothetical protein